MICWECRAAGQRSIVEHEGTETTCLAWRPYYDEAGVYHNHDPNQHVAHYRCSNGHQLRRKWLAPCPNCDYGRGEK